MSITGAYTWEDISSLGMEAYFQPIYNVEKHRITGLEALFRAKDGQGGFLDPESLVQEAEEGGWVHSIDLWMIRECCRWFTRFAEYGITRINVNLSPQTCMEEAVWEEISRCLDRYGLQHGKIWLEMTELGKTADNGKLLETAHKLQDKKFNLVMDDFGKGESNFIRLMDFEFQSIKLDKELVWGIGSRKMGMPIVQTLLVFAQRNHIWVTAEGIETREQASQLEELGCNFLQGYLISRPLPAEECVAFVAQWEKADILEETGAGQQKNVKEEIPSGQQKNIKEEILSDQEKMTEKENPADIMAKESLADMQEKKERRLMMRNSRIKTEGKPERKKNPSSAGLRWNRKGDI